MGVVGVVEVVEESRMPGECVSFLERRDTEWKTHGKISRTRCYVRRMRLCYDRELLRR